MKTAAIFCSASYTINPKYNEIARQVVRLLCENGVRIVSGGTVKGTMGVVADEASKYNLGNIGILPRFMADVAHPNLSQLIWTESMSQRKDALVDIGKDYAIALPGGIGTMDELFSTFTLAKVKKYFGKVIAYNYNGFYDKLKDLLDFYVETEMLDKESRGLIYFPKNLEELSELL